MKKNIVLIGMAGAGKTTIGKKLASLLKMNFVDVDEYIEKKENRKIQDILKEGEETFKKIEEKRIFELKLENSIITTGGSVVLSPSIMNFLKQNSIIIFIDVPFSIIKKRLGEERKRRIVKSGLTSLKEIYDFRIPLYRKYADIIIKENYKGKKEIIYDLIKICQR